MRPLRARRSVLLSSTSQGGWPDRGAGGPPPPPRRRLCWARGLSSGQGLVAQIQGRGVTGRRACGNADKRVQEPCILACFQETSHKSFFSCFSKPRWGLVQENEAGNGPPRGRHMP